LSYNKTTCTFTITDEKATGFNTESYFRKVFAVTINKEVIYTGYFWSPLSSAIVDWIVIGGDISYFSSNAKNEIKVQLGYPSLLEGMKISDLRNDKRIISLMQNTNRLKE